MMLNGEIHACWDQPTDTIVVKRTEPSKLQFLALQFADKCCQLVEANERILDSRTGGYGYKNEQGGRGDGVRERKPWVERSDRYGGGGRGGGRGGGGGYGGKGGGGGYGGGYGGGG
eukprot:2976461-Pleurochrysis_carterae.AAC.1